MLIYAALIVFTLAPLMLGLAGLGKQAGHSAVAAPEAKPPLNWPLMLGSAVCCCIAFNVTFFIQEVGLVVPKALIPGITSTLFHNNHSWQGEHELAYLFQGTGALATLLSGMLCFYAVRSGRFQSVGSRLLLLWMAYHGIFMALPQVVIGALNPYNDVGMAMDYFNLTAGSKTVLAFLALMVMPALAMMFTKPFLSLAAEQASVLSRSGRHRIIAQLVTLPALMSIVLVIPYRIPREWIEVLILPIIVLFVGTVWIQANAWRVSNVKVTAAAHSVPLKLLGFWALLLLLLFQLVLRPGITINFF